MVDHEPIEKLELPMSEQKLPPPQDDPLENSQDEQEEEILDEQDSNVPLPEFQFARFFRSKWYKKRSIVLISLTSIFGVSLILLGIWLYMFTSMRMFKFHFKLLIRIVGFYLCVMEWMQSCCC